jgi:hypothetical protein
MPYRKTTKYNLTAIAQGKLGKYTAASLSYKKNTPLYRGVLLASYVLVAISR